MSIEGFTLTRFQSRRNRTIDDRQGVQAFGRYCAFELTNDPGDVGLKFGAGLSPPCLLRNDIVHTSEKGEWLGFRGRPPAGVVFRLFGLRTGSTRRTLLLLKGALNHACVNLPVKDAGLSLHHFKRGTVTRASNPSLLEHDLTLGVTTRREHTGSDLTQPDDLPHCPNRLRLSSRPKIHAKGTPYT